MLKQRIWAAVIGTALLLAAAGASAGVVNVLADLPAVEGQAVAANSGGRC